MKVLQTSIVALFILALVALTGTVFFYAQIEGERKARTLAEKNKMELLQLIESKEKSVQEKTQTLTSLQAQVDELTAENRTKNQELTRNRTTIAQLDSKAKDLSEKIRLLESENKRLNVQLERYQKVNGSYDLPVAQNEPAVSEENIVPSVPSPAASADADKKQSEVNGKVILVNREYHFIVVGIGKLDGVKIKDQIEIFRGNDVIGKVTVSKLYDSLSSCEIVQEGNLLIQEGDAVRLLSS